MNHPRRSAGILTAALVVVASLTACSDDLVRSGDTSADTTSVGGQVIAPVIVELTELDGTTVTVPLGNVVVVNADAPASWTATVADESIATFTPGSDDGSAVFNPGFAPLQAGSTTVTMSDGTTTVTFTLDVTA